jgi:seryl-tRNA synthetase
MLDIQYIRDNPDDVKRAITVKSAGDTTIVDTILSLDTTRRSIITSLQQRQSDARTAARAIGDLMKSGRREEAETAKSDSAQIKKEVRLLEEQSRESQIELDRLMLDVPNVPHVSVPVGNTPEDNRIVFESENRKEFEFEPLAHWKLLQNHELADFERGSKVAGAGFPFYIGKGARLQRALINFFLDSAVDRAGYIEMQTPLVVNADSATGTGNLPDKEDLMYEASRDGLYLIPTAEIPTTNFHRDEIIPEKELPLRYCTYSPCFRREAGSWGSDVRGLNRLHQFDKVELVQIVHPDKSYDALESLREDAERLLIALGLPYRRLLMCTGDMGFTQSKKYDLEVWSGGQERWLEVSSISNFESFQARRMKIRYRPADGGKPVIVHTLNGSGLALPRIVAALLENNQRADGSVRIPPVLVPYTGFGTIG